MPSDHGFSHMDGDTGDSPDDIARVLLFMESGRNRELLLETLGERYDVETTTDIQTLESEFDCCVFDQGEFNRVAGTLQLWRDASEPTYLPFVLLADQDIADTTVTEAWEYVDDIIKMPVKKAALLSRIGNLVKRRQTAVQLAQREAQLERTVEDLKLKERAMDEAPVGILIAVPEGEDNPLIYVNKHFETLTGYRDTLGEDCRYLQGEKTDPETVTQIREAIEAREPVSVEILNYRKSGQTFWNKLDIAPIFDEDDNVTHFVGFQTDITDLKLRERRLEVLNRVLSHNLRNRMNVIEGYLALLQDEYEDEESPKALTEIRNAADNLMGLADTVQKIERTLDASRSVDTVINLVERVEQLIGGIEDQFPDAIFTLTTPESESFEVDTVGLITAIEEACKNAVKHNDSPDPTVDIEIERISEDWIKIEITDNGPGIPAQELDVLEEGETPLQHANRLGIWLIHWVVSKEGGEFSVVENETKGTTVRLSVPVAGQ